MKITKYTVLSSLIWKLMERGGTQGIQFVVMIVLTRLLLPEQFGLIIITLIFINLANLIVEGGFSTSLIQKKAVDELDYSTVFNLNMVVSTILYFIIYFIAPLIATIYGEPQIVPILRIQGIGLFIGAANSIQNAMIARNMLFKKLFISSFLAVIVSGMIGITMAYANFGVWSLVAQQLSSQLLITIFLWNSLNWRPKLKFSFERLRGLYSFGWKLVASTILYTLYTNIQSLVIGKVFTNSVLGFYSRGGQLPNLIVYNINGSIQSVLFPALASVQDDKVKLKGIVRRSIMSSSFILFPMMIGLAAIAEPLVTILFTEKWLPTVPFLQIFCAYYALWTIDAANLNVIKALGLSKLFLKLEMIKFVTGIILLGIALPLGVHIVALSVLLNRILSTIIDAYPSLKLIDYGFQQQFKDIFPTLFISFVMGGIVYGISFIEMSNLKTLVIQLLIGITLYLSLAKSFKIESFTYLVNNLRDSLWNQTKSKLIREK